MISYMLLHCTRLCKPKGWTLNTECSIVWQGSAMKSTAAPRARVAKEMPATCEILVIIPKISQDRLTCVEPSTGRGVLPGRLAAASALLQPGHLLDPRPSTSKMFHFPQRVIHAFIPSSATTTIAASRALASVLASELSKRCQTTQESMMIRLRLNKTHSSSAFPHLILPSQL